MAVIEAMRKNIKEKITMNGAKNLKGLSGILVVLLLMNSCAEFFSTSWGETFKRNPKNVNVTDSNVNDLLDVAKGNTELSKAILDQIDAGSSDELKHAAIKAANQASGISTLALENVQTLIDAVDKGGDQKALETIAREILDAAKSNNLADISDKLVEILNSEMDVTSIGNHKTALISAGKIVVPVPQKTGGGNPAKIYIDMGNDSDNKGKTTIIVNGKETTYDCEVNDTTITLKNQGKNEKVADIKYDVNDANALVLSDLDRIPTIANVGSYVTEASSSDNNVPSGKPEFEQGFLDGVSESDLTLIVMTLILAKIEKEEKNGGNLDEYMELWTKPEEGQEKDVITGKNLDGDEKLVAAIVNGMISRNDDMSELTDMVKELLGIKDK
jgi:hypothetical protein